MLTKTRPLRSEAYRRYVSEQPCIACGITGYTQVAHRNEGKGMATKTCDSLTMPLCGPHHGMLGCHQLYDLALDGLTRDERREWARGMVEKMQARAMEQGWDMTTLRRAK